MKKILFMFMAAACMAFASCSGNPGSYAGQCSENESGVMNVKLPAGEKYTGFSTAASDACRYTYISTETADGKVNIYRVCSHRLKKEYTVSE